MGRQRKRLLLQPLNNRHLDNIEPAMGYVFVSGSGVAQVAALEKKKHDDEADGEIETAHPDYLGSQDTFYVGNLKGVGRIYQQTFVDTYRKVG